MEEKKGRSRTRQEIIEDGRRIVAEIRQIFADAEHWNRLHPEEEQRIDPDPHGTLRELLRRLTGEEPKPSQEDLERMRIQEES
jgi:hypothetical protein